ncbi:MAG: HPP family protein [Candidatus Theseobacter exili]|nr:HPP family protein [Candidatus Theseobacter exili]
MKRSVIKMVEEFRLFWKNYVFQSLFATFTTFIVLLFLSLQYAVIIASIASTAFIVFAMPKSITAKPRNIIGGHLVGLFFGSLCALIPHHLFLPSIIAYSFAVGFSIFIMVITDTEHPPASGTALGVAITGPSLNITIAVITSVIILSLVHYFFKPFLKDLT